MGMDIEAYRADVARYESKLAEARKTYPEEHPWVRQWVRRRAACLKMIEILEARS